MLALLSLLSAKAMYAVTRVHIYNIYTEDFQDTLTDIRAWRFNKHEWTILVWLVIHHAFLDNRRVNVDDCSLLNSIAFRSQVVFTRRSFMLQYIFMAFVWLHNLYVINSK